MRYFIGGSLRCSLVLIVTILLCRNFYHKVQAIEHLPPPQAQPNPPPTDAQAGVHSAAATAFTRESPFNLSTLFNITGPVLSSFSDRRCLMCRFSVSLINYALKTKRGDKQIDRIANSFCMAAHIESRLVCSKITKLFNNEITKVLTYGIVTPNQICGLLSNNTCGHFHSPLDEWEVSLEASQHFEVDQALFAARREEIDSEVAKQRAYRVIHLSDTHIDLKYTPGAPAKCREPLCCQQTSTPLDATTDQAKAGFWGSYGTCDLPLRTFEAGLKFLNATIGAADDIDYILWTGDIQPHDVWDQSKQAAVRIYDTVFAKIFEHLPGIRILPTLGNHEMIPADSFSPSNLIEIARDDSPVWLYKKLDSFWSRWLPADTADTITRDGFYATTIRPGLKAISLNTNFCHSKNFWLFINSTDPGQQLQWLVHELQMSELTHERVHIIGHIPPGADDCLKVWSENYNRILRRFKNTITGQFFGHTHNNEFEMLYEFERNVQVTAAAEKAKEKFNSSIARNVSASLSKAVINAGTTSNAKNSTLKPIGVGFVGPSITTFVDLNPSFRIYNIDPRQNFQPTDFETYFMNLTAANLNTAQEPQWTSAGMFSESFGLNDTLPESMHKLLVDIANDLKDSDGDDEDNGDSVDDGGSDDNDAHSGKPANVLAASALRNRPDGEDEALHGDDRLFRLYRIFNSYSDAFSKAKYDQITSAAKRKFLCRLFTGEAHNSTACGEFLPKVDMFRLSPGPVASN